MHLEYRDDERKGMKKSGIMIIGPSGCGKTTLGNRVAWLLGIPYFDVDEYIWRFDTPELYTVMYSREEKIARLKKAIAPHEHFVMAGSMSSFHEEFDPYFGMMVFLYADPDVRISRIRERSIRRFGERVMEGGDMYQSNLEFLEANRRYESDGSPNLMEQRAWMNGLPCKKIELDGADCIEKNAELVLEAWKNLTPIPVWTV